ncbi:Crp/Fnr family transcriptional regulator [Sphingomonas sp. 36D10-4-7]|jgi:CRP-like cAMP-binding protein|uniref:Crp/Fnr family transcriptional regulator n=2 Tax=Sphingomonas corticis TaxID=2722791 RepID=A0ABX1CKM7_9SPHN|nr:Crp/Fnr family transcriptional regulator [Sphingomonas corticis]
MRVTEDFLRGRGRAAMSEQEKDVLEAAVDRVQTLPARTILSHRGDRVSYSTLLLDGVMCRYMDARDGFRQLVAIQLPGDFVDLHGYPLMRLDHDVATLTEARIATFPHDRLTEILEEHPHLARLLWRSTLLDAALHREWIFRLGRLDAVGRIAHVLLETQARLAAVGRVSDGRFALPLTQQDLGEACGLTAVHVNRTLRRLREEGLAEMTRGEVRIMDATRLARVAEFDPDYLYLEGGPWQEA